ncbi:MULTISPECIES: Mu transposase C-terminal domain-containing protein [unclassified Acinetobacter]|uniref:Mu transposase C-terminal domain-containing protein n=1 Tax=unclassified Acinetobacter TaxID=196816 RepID=UPI00190AC72E|nr:MULTISPECIES: Mu transposase C-terminal domain-containing protein [unclassified Acinetobacter]MBK0062416.1 transposase [Acinetobacter sp. S55]MBK0066220.1 transposase [Acinetobacter sp. S54]
MKVYYSIADLQALELAGLPTTRRGLEKYVLSKQFKYREVASRGKGGVKREYELNDELKQLVVIRKVKNDAVELVNCELNTVVSAQPNHFQNPNDLMDWQREVAENRLFVVRFIDQKVKAGLKKTKAVEQFILDAASKNLPGEMQEAVRKANAKAGEDRHVSRRTVFDWIKAVEDAEKHKINILSVLAPKQRTSSIPAWAGALLKLWGQPQKPTLPAVLEVLPSYLENNIQCPSYAQAYRFLNEKMGNVDLQKGRMGARELKNIKGFIRRDTSNMYATDVYTADGHCFDAEIAHPIHGKPFRPEITSIIDVATRRIVGWSIDLSENRWAVLDAIRMSATECGIPAIFYVDNGSGYKNDLLKGRANGILSRLNVTVSHALPYNSQAKGLIERSHQTLWVKAAKNLPTYIGKDMDAEASNKAHKLTRSEIIKFGQSKSLMSWTDFVNYAANVVDAYNNKPHSSLKRITDPVTMKSRHMTPLEMWNAALDQEQPIDRVDDWDLENFFRPTIERKVRRCEIELFSNRYFHRDLEQYHDELVQVGYDIHCAEKVTVRDMDGRLICIAIWNHNKRDYFPKTVIEQAREKRADGRLRRLAVKQAEAIAELNPQKVIEHLENQNVIPFDQIKRQKLMTELEALPVQPKPEERIYFKDVNLPKDKDDKTAQVFNTPVERWMFIDEQILNNAEEISKEDQDFWTLFQMSKKFKQLSLDDETLKTYLERRQVS